MIFKFITNDRSYKNYFILEYATFYDKEVCENEITYILFDGFEKAIEAGFEPNYLSSTIIEGKVYWVEKEYIDEFLIYFFQENIKDLKVYPIFRYKELRQETELLKFADEKNEYFINTTDSLYIIDKENSKYFNIKKDLSELTIHSYKQELLIFLRSSLCFYSFDEIIYELRRLFGKYYVLYLRFIMFYESMVYDTVMSTKWKQIALIENIFNKIKIYNVTPDPSVNFNFQIDEDGKKYLQYEYNAFDSVTGRLFPQNLNGFQSLQTLQKDKRHLLKAEENCILIELDFDSFEFKLFEMMAINFLGKKLTYKHTDPHLDICVKLHLFQNRVLGKKINYAIIYGANINTIIDIIKNEYIGVDIIELECELKNLEILKIRDDLISFLKTHYYNEESMILTNQFCRKIKIEKEWAVLNNFIQSTAVDIINNITIELDAYFYMYNNHKILLQNHDSILISLKVHYNKYETLKVINSKIYNSLIELGTDFGDYIKYSIYEGFDWGNMKCINKTRYEEIFEESL